MTTEKYFSELREAVDALQHMGVDARMVEASLPTSYITVGELEYSAGISYDDAGENPLLMCVSIYEDGAEQSLDQLNRMNDKVEGVKIYLDDENCLVFETSMPYNIIHPEDRPSAMMACVSAIQRAEQKIITGNLLDFFKD